MPLVERHTSQTFIKLIITIKFFLFGKFSEILDTKKSPKSVL